MSKTIKQKWIYALTFVCAFALVLTAFMSVGSITAHAEGETHADASSVSVNNGKGFATDGAQLKYYYVNGAEETTTSSTGYNAYYNPITGILELNGYNGGLITLSGSGKTNVEQTIKLVGDNVINATLIANQETGIRFTNIDNIIFTGSGTLTINVPNSAPPALLFRGIYVEKNEPNKLGNITFESGKVTINVTSTVLGSENCAIDTREMTVGGNVTIGESAELDITITNQGGNYEAGIVAYGDVIVNGKYVFNGVYTGEGNAPSNRWCPIESYDGDIIIGANADIDIQMPAGVSTKMTTVKYALNGGNPVVYNSMNGDDVTCRYQDLSGKRISFSNRQNAEFTKYEYKETATYTVSFDKNDANATGDMSQVSNISGNYTIPVCTFTAPSGKQFKGWSLTQNGVTIISHDVTANVTFYAIWEDIPAVTSVTVTPNAPSVQKGTSQQFSASVVGVGAYSNDVTWTVEGGIAGTSISNTGLLTVAEDETATTITVKATSTTTNTVYGTATVTITNIPVTKYQVTVTNGTGSADYEENATVTITANAPAEGKQFAGWTVTAGGVTLVDSTATTTTFTMGNQAVTVVANYENITYTVSFNKNDANATGTMVDVTEVNGYYMLPACSFTAPTGKQFKGWSLTTNGETITSYDVTANVTFFAIWEDIPTYTVSFNANGGSGEMSDVTKVRDNYILPPCTFTAPSGQHFQGWSLTNDGAIITEYNVTANVTFYAIWVEDAHVHAYTNEMVDGQYLKTPATCTEKAVYYKSCECGLAGTGTFESGEPLGHDFVNGNVYQKDENGHAKKCSRCNAYDTVSAHNYGGDNICDDCGYDKTVPHIHAYTEENATPEFLKTPANCTDKAVYYKSCSCGAKGMATFESGDALGHDYGEDGVCTVCGHEQTSTTPDPTDDPNEPTEPEQPTIEPEKEGLSGGAIAGIVVGSTAVAGLGGFSIFWFVIKKKKFADLIAIFKKK